MYLYPGLYFLIFLNPYIKTMGCGLCKSAFSEQYGRGKEPIQQVGKLFTVAEERSELEETKRMKESRVQTLLSQVNRLATETLEEEKQRSSLS